MTSLPLTNDEATSAELLHSKGLKRQDALDIGFENTKLWGSKRLLVAILMFFSYFYIFMLRGNLSIAIVEMTSEKNTTSGDQIITQKPEFAWDMKTKAWLLSLFSYGYACAIFGGYLSTKYGGVTVNGLGILLTAILTILSPFFLRVNFYLFAIGRIVEGTFDGFAYAATCDIWSRWIPMNELPQVIAFSHVGHNVAAALTFPLCGLIAQHFGWAMIFYFSGTFAIIWCIIFLTMIRNDPSQDAKISSGELRYLKRSIEFKKRENIKYPWNKIIKSKPLWCLCLNKIAYSWSMMTLVYCLPLYIKDVTKKNTAQVGFISGIPNMANLIITPITGLFLGYLQNRPGLNSSQLQKWMLIMVLSLSGALFIAVGFTSFAVTLIIFVILVALFSIISTLLQVMVISISHDHAGLVAGISAFWYSISSIVAPLTIGFIVVNHTWQEWCICFGLNGGVVIFTAIMTALYGSNDDQQWSSINQDEDIDTIDTRPQNTNVTQ
ncbi:sialin-like isoform X2 [Planococcus citri]|uniref:sialin-like isoform X2 n=1 Tax=Planococcus citri TaxID=170843 RepID=UPI0031F7F8F3